MKVQAFFLILPAARIPGELAARLKALPAITFTTLLPLFVMKWFYARYPVHVVRRRSQA
jgi:hypothetical protein